MARQTRRKTRRVKRRDRFTVEHHHCLFRIETETCPSKEDAEHMKHVLEEIVTDIGMKRLGDVHVYYVSEPAYNEGLTAITTIETSHLAMHFWSRPKRQILHSKKSRCLLQADIYTCGTLTPPKIAASLHHFTQFNPTYAEITLLNRNYGLTVDRHTHWQIDNTAKETWAEWLNSPRFH